MKNYVQIQTSERTGSGVILSCEIDQRIWGEINADEKSYIVLTNYHVIQDIKQDGRDKKSNIRLKIQDIHGEEIERKMIRHIYVESGANYDYGSDVAALLVIVKDCCEIACCNNIYMGDHSKAVIETYGYPHIFQSNWINHDICMEGVIQKYTNEGIGLYTIKDDYHSYSNISDKSLMDGISGAPVYLTCDDGRTCLVGINEAVCNIGEGNNPFKMVYFLPIDKVLTWLAQQQIILYKYSAKTVKIIWLKKREDGLEKVDPEERKRKLDLEKPKNIVLIGSSGAGKSAFLSTLCQHGQQLGSVGDGQTTRKTMVYHLKLKEAKPRVEISFQSQNKFMEARQRNFQAKRYELILCQIYGMEKKDIDADPCCYLQDLTMPLMALKKCFSVEMNKEIEVLFNQISQLLYEYQGGSDEEDLKSRAWELYEKILILLKKIFDNGFVRPGLKKGFLDRKKYEAYKKDHQDSTMDAFYREFLQTEDDAEEPAPEDLEKALKRILVLEEGFYDISDFFYLDETAEKKDWDAIFDKYFLRENELIPFDDFTAEAELDLEENDPEGEFSLIKNVRSYYAEIYETIRKKLNEKGIDITKPLQYSLEMVTPAEKAVIARCMRKVGKDSLTGIVAEVNVYDRFADTYAYDFHHYRVNGLRIYDTCGYDHIERQNLYVYFKTLFNQIKATRKNANGEETSKRQVDAIIYVKKLDSEKPTELEKILPVVNRMEVSTPIFCLFTAIDQYVDISRNVSCDMIWNRDYYEKWKGANTENTEYIFPKSVQTLYENKKIRETLQVPEYMKDKIVEFIQNHMVPYTSRYGVNDENLIALNRNSIIYILKSILLDKWNMGFLVPSDHERTEGIPDTEVLDVEVEQAVRRDLKRMFEVASRTKWQARHHSTVRANFRRLYRYDEEYDAREQDLGFNRTNIDRWDNLLEDGYTGSFLADDSETIRVLCRKYGLSDKKTYEIIARAKSLIINEAMAKWAGKNDGKTFRKSFESLYDQVELKYMDGMEERRTRINLFQRQKKVKVTRDQMVEFLNEVCNFSNMLDRRKDIEDDMVRYIQNVIYEAFQDNNNLYLENLYIYDEKFRDGIDYISNLIGSYTDGNDLQNPLQVLAILKAWEKKREEEKQMKGGKTG